MIPPNPSNQPAAPLKAEAMRPGHRSRPGLRILYICHRVPYPPDKGEKIRAFHEIRALARRHRVHLLTLADGPVPDLAALDSLCERVEVFLVSRQAAYARSLLGLFRLRPLTLSFFESRELEARVRELAAREQYDLVVGYSSSVGPYLDLIPGVPKVIDMVDVDSAKWAQYARFAPLPLRPIYALEARRLRAYEAVLATRVERVVLATAAEARLLQSFAPAARVSAVANGVDLDYFQPLDLPKAPRPTLVFTGQMDYFANVDGIVHFARRVFPRLRERMPDLELLVVGRSPAPAVRALGDLPGVLVTGAVGDVRPFLSRAWIFVAPLRIAQGVQNKVLEAMASRLPVVCTERVHAGLSEGGFRHERDLLVARTDEEMERCVASLLTDEAARERLAECARQRLLGFYRWGPNMERFEELLGSAVRPGGPQLVDGRLLLREIPPEPGAVAEGARSA
jgi:sugar transferase (PEP-CTERM/EpsH1 system associated)